MKISLGVALFSSVRFLGGGSATVFTPSLYCLLWLQGCHIAHHGVLSRQKFQKHGTMQKHVLKDVVIVFLCSLKITFPCACPLVVALWKKEVSKKPFFCFFVATLTLSLCLPLLALRRWNTVSCAKAKEGSASGHVIFFFLFWLTRFCLDEGRRGKERWRWKLEEDVESLDWRELMIRSLQTFVLSVFTIASIGRSARCMMHNLWLCAVKDWTWVGESVSQRAMIVSLRPI